MKALALAIVATLSVASPAHASLLDPIEGGPGTPFTVYPALDVGVITLDLGVILSMKHLVDHPHTDGNRGDLNALDARVVGWGTHDEATYSSDTAVGLGLAYMVVDTYVTGKHDGGASGAVTVGLYAESLLTSLAIVEVVKQSVQRPRPCSYQTERRYRENLHCGPEDDDAYLSFPSGHTATAAALSATAIYLAFSEDGSGVRGSVALAGGLALTGFTAAERMRAGKHFPTDVMTGAAIGATVGVLVPYLHHRERTNPTGTATSGLVSDGKMISISGIFP